MEKKLRSIHEGIIGWTCEQHPSKPFEHRLFFGLGEMCAGPGEAVHDPKWLQERKEEEIRERKFAEFFDLYPQYKNREKEVREIITHYL